MTTGLRCCRCCLEVLLCSPLPFRGDEPPYISGRQGGHKWPHPIRHPGLVVDLYSRGMYKGNKNSSVQNLVLFPLLGKYLKTMKANTCRLRSRTLVNSLVTSKFATSVRRPKCILGKSDQPHSRTPCQWQWTKPINDPWHGSGAVF